MQRLFYRLLGLLGRAYAAVRRAAEDARGAGQPVPTVRLEDYEALRHQNDVLADMVRQLYPTVAGLSRQLLELQRSTEADRATAGGLERLESGLSSAEERLLHAQEEIAGLSRALARLGALVDQEKVQTGERLQAIEQKTVDLRTQLVDLPERILARETRNAEEAQRFDDFYLAFEDRFRGSRDDILKKVSEYVPLVLENQSNGAECPVIDLGCGRGEWLEALRAVGCLAKGVDVSSAMVATSRQLGLDVVESDALAFLRSQKAATVGCISAFHLVEHIPLQALIDLFQEARRVLRPGGLLILETPNPQNVIVGACNFYIDPTHESPIPPMTLQFIAEYSGFEDVQIIPKHAFDEMHHFAQPRTPTEELLNNMFFGAQDYALIAKKNASN